MTRASDVVQTTTRVCILISLAVAALFLGAARSAGSSTVAQYGGALWVFILALLISLPLLTPVFRRRARE